ncbi:hypothetical protein [Streptomyces sp. NPDC006368]|uniref:hypothetical protein n=1 Tax=Streptomyces sp. NPDC006368 TaxID=3156760 RepID=UPI0033B35F38
MGSEGHRTVRRPQAVPEHVCRACGKPVGTALKKRKILGVWAPVWEPQSCRNPACALFTAQGADESGESGKTAETA